MTDRIVIDPDICHGKPCIKGTRILVGNILNLLAHGARMEEVLEGYPQISEEDVYAALRYAESIANDGETDLTD